MIDINWKKAIGIGVLIWLLMFAFVSAVLDLYQSTIWMKIVVALVAGLLAFFLTIYVKPKNVGTALGYGLVWVLVGIILDGLITMRFNSEIFKLWSLWLGYLLILIAPLFKIELNSE